MNEYFNCVIEWIKKVRYSQEKWIKCDKKFCKMWKKCVECDKMWAKLHEKIYVQYFHIRKTIPQLKYFT